MKEGGEVEGDGYGVGWFMERKAEAESELVAAVELGRRGVQAWWSGSG
jgi:hypothetical protein